MRCGVASRSLRSGASGGVRSGRASGGVRSGFVSGVGRAVRVGSFGLGGCRSFAGSVLVGLPFVCGFRLGWVAVPLGVPCWLVCGDGVCFGSVGCPLVGCSVLVGWLVWDGSVLVSWLVWVGSVLVGLLGLSYCLGFQTLCQSFFLVVSGFLRIFAY